jgi:hypothetical protein
MRKYIATSTQFGQNSNEDVLSNAKWDKSEGLKLYN